MLSRRRTYYMEDEDMAKFKLLYSNDSGGNKIYETWSFNADDEISEILVHSNFSAGNIECTFWGIELEYTEFRFDKNVNSSGEWIAICYKLENGVMATAIPNKNLGMASGVSGVFENGTTTNIMKFKVYNAYVYNFYVYGR